MSSQATAAREIEKPRRWSASVPWDRLGVVVAIALVAWGQVRIEHRFQTDLPVLSTISDELNQVYGRPQSVLPASLLFLTGGALFVWSVSRSRAKPDGGGREVSLVTLSSLELRGFIATRTGKVAVTLVVVGLGLWAYLVANLASGSYRAYYPIVFGLALVLFTVPILFHDAARGRIQPRLGVQIWEPFLVLGVCLVVVVLNVGDLDGWRYAFIGDEGAFFNVAKEIMDGASRNFFSHRGVYDRHQVAESYYQAASLRVFGADYLGWKMASLLGAVAALPAAYVLVRACFGIRPAVFATIFLAASHYVFAFVHTGYDNIFALFPFALAPAFFWLGLRTPSLVALFLAGVVSGLAFYVFPTALAAPAAVALLIVTLGPAFWRPYVLLPLAFGFVVAALPIFAVDGLYVFEVMLRQSATTNAPGRLVDLVARNVPLSLFAFHFNPERSHYVAGPLMDRVSGGLAVLGLAYACWRIRDASSRFFVIAYLITLVGTGVFNIHERVAITRMHVVLIPLAAFAGVALDRILDVFQPERPRIDQRILMNAAALAVLASVLFVVNVDQFRSRSARAVNTTLHTVAVRAVSEKPCAGRGKDNLIVGEFAYSNAMVYIFDIYGRRDSPVIFSYEQLKSSTAALPSGCLVLMNIEGEDARAYRYRLEAAKPGLALRTLTDLAGGSQIWVVDPGDSGR